MNNNFLDTIINNVYENTRVDKYTYKLLINMRDEIKYVINMHLQTINNFDYTMINQGSHLTRTLLVYDGNITDIDIGIIFDINTDMANYPNYYKKIIKNCLLKNKYIRNKYYIKQGKSCIQCILKHKSGTKIIIEIATYIRCNNEIYFGYKNEWVYDKKLLQNYLYKKLLSQDGGKKLRKIIIFLKYIRDGDKKIFEKLKSIFILEMILQYTPDTNKKSVSHIIINILKKIKKKFKKDFELPTIDGSEDLFNNDKRFYKKNDILPLIEKLIISFNSIIKYNYITADNFIRIYNNDHKIGFAEKYLYFTYVYSNNIYDTKNTKIHRQIFNDMNNYLNIP